MKDSYELFDLFAGLGNMTTGAEQAIVNGGARIRHFTAVNHWRTACQSNKHNHPYLNVYEAGVDQVNPRLAHPSGKVDLGMAAPECTYHSRANGKRKRPNEQSRSSAWHFVRWLELLHVSHFWLENVPEFRDWGPVDSDGYVIESRKGETFKAFIGVLESLNYKVEWRLVNCADFGDPTTRERLFILGSKGRYPKWAKPTHSQKPNFLGLKPWRSTAEIIRWDVKGTSIYGRKKPLVPNTMARIFEGLKKFGGSRFLPTDMTLEEFSAKPFILNINGGEDGYVRGHGIDEPLHTTKTSPTGALIQSYLIPQHGGGAPRGVDMPGPTIAGAGAIGMVQPWLSQYHGGESGSQRNYPIGLPIPVIDTSNRYALLEPHLIRYYGGEQGVQGTQDLRLPVGTISTNNHFALMEPFLTRYYGSEQGEQGTQSIWDPLGTVTTKDRFGLIVPEPGLYKLDILHRMLLVEELAAAHSIPKGFRIFGTTTDQKKQIGNSVPIETVRAHAEAILG